MVLSPGLYEGHAWWRAGRTLLKKTVAMGREKPYKNGLFTPVPTVGSKRVPAGGGRARAENCEFMEST